MSKKTIIKKEKEINDRELRLTAAVYTRLRGVLTHVKEFGTLPQQINASYAYIPMRLIIEERGTDITLTPNEQLVYDALIKGGRLTGGSVHLVGKDKPEA